MSDSHLVLPQGHPSTHTPFACNLTAAPAEFRDVKFPRSRRTIEMEPPPVIPNVPNESAPMTLFARLLNIFAIPGAVFQDVRDAIRWQPGSWLVPVFLATIVTSFSLGTILSRPELLNELKTKQTEAIQEQLQAGKISKAEAESGIRTIEWLGRPEVINLFLGVGSFAASLLRVFFWTLALWLLARWFLKTPVNWLKASEAAGLASMVSVLGSLVVAILMFSVQGDGNANVAGTLQQLELRNKAWPVVLASNGFNIWFVFLLATALARLAGVPLSRTLFLVMGTWLALQLGFGFLVAGFGFAK